MEWNDCINSPQSIGAPANRSAQVPLVIVEYTIISKLLIGSYQNDSPFLTYLRRGCYQLFKLKNKETSF